MNSNDIYDTLVTKVSDHPRSMHNLRRYVKFIYACIKRNSTFDGYTEEHHILPKCSEFWPEYINLVKHKWNKADLTGHQHFIAHMMLAIALSKGQWNAAHMMTVASYTHNRNYRVTGRQYEMIKIQNALNTSKRFKGVSKSDEHRRKISAGVKSSITQDSRQALSDKHTGSGNPRYGVEVSQETRDKKSVSMTGRLAGEKNPMFGKSHDAEARAKISAAAKLRVVPDEQRAIVSAKLKLIKELEPDYTCPHCGKVGRKPSVFRYHFDKCKSKPAHH